MAKRRKRKKKLGMYVGIVVVVLILVGAIALFAGDLVQQQALGGSEIQRIAIPHFASFKCDVVGSGNPTKVIPEQGFWISRDDIGAYTNNVQNIKVIVGKSFWDYFVTNFLGGGVRIYYKQCNANKLYCTEGTQGLTTWGTYNLNAIPSSINPEEKSVYIAVQTRLTAISQWQNTESNSQISYSFEKFGLTLSSTTQDPAGAVICTSTCDLTCPQQGYQEKLVYTTKNTLPFYETAPYLEYWEDINYDLNAQGGATVYNAQTDKFCLAGAIYQASRIKLDSGATYVYPNTATGQLKQCCPGAVVATSYGEKVCGADYEWDEVTQDTRIPCVSDINCPGAGLNTCQVEGSKYIRGGWYCASDGFCAEKSGQEVECCPVDKGCASDQTCQNYQCVGGTGGDVGGGDTISKNKTECQDSSWLGIQGQWVEAETTTCNFWCKLGITKPDTKVEPYCKFPGQTTIIIAIAIGAFLFLIILVVALMPSSKGKGNRKSNGAQVGGGQPIIINTK